MRGLGPPAALKHNASLSLESAAAAAQSCRKKQRIFGPSVCVGMRGSAGGTREPECARLVENVVAALARVEGDDTGLLKEVGLNDCALDVASAPENDLDPLSVPGVGTWEASDECTAGKRRPNQKTKNGVRAVSCCRCARSWRFQTPPGSVQNNKNEGVSENRGKGAEAVI